MAIRRKKKAKKAQKAKKPCRVSNTPSDALHWDRVVSAAFLRLLEHTQRETAKVTGICVRTIQRWESAPSWAQAKAEATSRWLSGLDGLTMRALRNGLLADDQATARWWASKRIRELGGSPTGRPQGAARPGDYGIVLTADQLRAMPDEQLEALDAALALAGGDASRGDESTDPGGAGASEI